MEGPAKGKGMKRTNCMSEERRMKRVSEKKPLFSSIGAFMRTPWIQ